MKGINELLSIGVPTTELMNGLPHRSPMVWIDRVLSYGKEGGECLVHLKDNAQYMSYGLLRPSSLIEFLAQAQGFIELCKGRENPDRPVKLNKAFLVGISNGEFENLNDFPEIYKDGYIIVRIGSQRTFSSLSLFSGSIWSSLNRQIGRADLKVFFS